MKPGETYNTDYSKRRDVLYEVDASYGFKEDIVISNGPRHLRPLCFCY